MGLQKMFHEKNTRYFLEKYVCTKIWIVDFNSCTKNRIFELYLHN